MAGCALNNWFCRNKKNIYMYITIKHFLYFVMNLIIITVLLNRSLKPQNCPISSLKSPSLKEPGRGVAFVHCHGNLSHTSDSSKRGKGEGNWEENIEIETIKKNSNLYRYKRMPPTCGPAWCCGPRTGNGSGTLLVLSHVWATG